MLVHDRRYPYDRGETIGRVSEDGGKTWLRKGYHISDGSGYPASVALNDGTIVTVVGNTQRDPRSPDRQKPGASRSCAGDLSKPLQKLRPLYRYYHFLWCTMPYFKSFRCLVLFFSVFGNVLHLESVLYIEYVLLDISNNAVETSHENQ